MDYVVILKFSKSSLSSQDFLPPHTCAFIRIVFCVESAAGISRTTPSAITRNISARLPAVFSCPSQTASEVYCVSTHWHTCLPTDTLSAPAFWSLAGGQCVKLWNCLMVVSSSRHHDITIQETYETARMQWSLKRTAVLQNNQKFRKWMKATNVSRAAFALEMSLTLTITPWFNFVGSLPTSVRVTCGETQISGK